MAYERKTEDLYFVLYNYGHGDGMEELYVATTYREAKSVREDYVLNEHIHPVIRKKRVKKSEHRRSSKTAGSEKTESSDDDGNAALIVHSSSMISKTAWLIEQRKQQIDSINKQIELVTTEASISLLAALAAAKEDLYEVLESVEDGSLSHEVQDIKNKYIMS